MTKPLQLTLFKKEAALPQPPEYITRSIKKVIDHTSDCIMYWENKAPNSPPVTYYFTGPLAGWAYESNLVGRNS